MRAHGPVLERVRAAGVGGHVAADLRLLGRARVGRQPEPALRARRRTSAVVMPASTSARHSSGSSERCARIRSSDSTTPPSGTAPPASRCRPRAA